MDKAQVAIPVVASDLQTFLALDFGLKRTGFAVGNRLLRSAQPQGTIKAEGDARFAKIAQHLKEWQPDALVVGVPFHPDGAAHENTLRARRFARQLHGRFKLPVFEVDERYSTTEARSDGARDADAAAVSVVYSGDEYVGLVTSGGYGYRLNQSIALAYVHTDLAVPGTELMVEILGERRRAVVASEPLYDPQNERLRS